MTLEQLRLFVAVAEREHMTRAAEALCLTQSAVSHAIMMLELEFGLAFFDRIGRRIVLTPMGKIFLLEARAVLARAETARQRMKDLTALDEGVLHLWASQTIASYWLPARINRFHRAHPAIRVTVTISNRAFCKCGGGADRKRLAAPCSYGFSRAQLFACTQYAHALSRRSGFYRPSLKGRVFGSHSQIRRAFCPLLTCTRAF